MRIIPFGNEQSMFEKWLSNVIGLSLFDMYLLKASNADVRSLFESWIEEDCPVSYKITEAIEAAAVYGFDVFVN